MNPGQVSAEQLEQLVTLRMPFGRYKGWAIADLPGNYLGWFSREGFPNGALGELLALMYEIDHNDLRSLLAPLRPQSTQAGESGGRSSPRR